MPAFAATCGGIHAVRAATDPPNTASIRVMERLGMTFERRGELNGLDTVFYTLNV
jgi:RimJ/RimL family protein N-acetyltransferase